MTTYVAFTPSSVSSPPFSTVLTLDGLTYGLACFWNLYSGSWYYQLTDQNGNIVITAALVGSPPSANIYLAPGILTTSTLLYRSATSNFETVP